MPRSEGGAHADLRHGARTARARIPDDIRIERNAFEVGPWQTGVLLVDVDRALVAGNHLSLPPGAQPIDAAATDEIAVRVLRKLIAEAIAPKGQNTIEVAIPGAGRSTCSQARKAEKLVQALAPTISASQGKRLGARRALDGGRPSRALGRSLPPHCRNRPRIVIALVRQQLLAVGQGIVVGGARAGTIQILDNLVEDTVQGIHVAVSRPKQAVWPRSR